MGNEKNFNFLKTSFKAYKVQNQQEMKHSSFNSRFKFYKITQITRL